MRAALRNYTNLAVGLTNLSRDRATAAAKALVSSGEATAEQVQALAEDLLATSKANRDAIRDVVRLEVERALGRMGLAGADEVKALTARVASVEAALRSVQTHAATAPTPAGSAPSAKEPT